MQLSGFARYSSLSYQPDAFGDLMYNGIAPWAQRTSFATGVQGDGELEGRAKPTRCAAASWCSASASPASPRPMPCRWSPTRPIRTPARRSQRPADRHHRRRRPHRLDLQRLPAGRMEGAADGHRELRPRFDAIYRHRLGEPAEPAHQRRVAAQRRLIALRAGYARYFVPPPLNQVNDGSIAALARHDGGPRAHDPNDPVRAERSRLFRRRPDGQAARRPDAGLHAAYYKFAENYSTRASSARRSSSPPSTTPTPR